MGLPTLHGTAPIPPSPFCRPARRPRYRVGLTYPDPSYPTRHQRYRVGHHVRPTLQDVHYRTYPAPPTLQCPGPRRITRPRRPGPGQNPPTYPTRRPRRPFQRPRHGAGALPWEAYPTAGPILPPRTGPRRAARPRREDGNCRPTLHPPGVGHSRPRRGTLKYHHRGPSSPLYSSDPTRAEARRRF